MGDFDFWFLVLLPVLFAAGWWLRGVDTGARRSAAQGAPQSMFRGLNLFLNEQPDKAIDAFIDVVKLDPETIELHHALGNLFRRRGEIDRAVRIHTHLFNRADLPAAERANALAELGQDFLKGGLLDRAEDAFVRLRDEPRHRLDALRSLARIYEMEREWAKAIDCARRLEREAGESHHGAIAHFNCELAEQALAQADIDAAQRYLAEAQATDRRSVRAAIIAGELAARRGDLEQAISLWLQIEAASPEHIALVARRLTEALDKLGRRAEALNFLRRNLMDTPSIDLLDITVERVAEWESQAAAQQLLREELKRHPSLLGFERLLAMRAATEDVLVGLHPLIKAQAGKLARYRCSKCGFRAREFHWQCPGCTSWDSYPPRRIEELNSA
ncbi:MAG: lipopolysaccharide assembly protein LapB [Gemmatimonadota bacterium]